ncbi:DNA-binding protein WhiA [Spiroplasma sp. TIUS-1]|uniref:DNA-binding protein WhiA n=1 Tax=Spiroplasma sp. TIUS-1 TaxID=216963 RepID=UPI001398EBB8|nr:DNA-binding protein WhiA [Spiroplasma sp. TIUS-1]QHX35617.1 DNA-binding protein WhiA [Spiroplasma sp. TIUS-1]
MSFSLEVKEDILSHTFKEKQVSAFLNAYIKYNANFSITNKGLSIQMSSNSNKVIRSIYEHLKTIFKGDIDIRIIQHQKLKKNKVFELILSGEIQKFLTEQNIYDFDNGDKVIRIPSEWTKKESIHRSYVAGLFVACGSVNSPTTTNYHLELQFNEEDSATYAMELLKNFPFKLIVRKNKYVIYMKKSTLISDFLRYIDATTSMMNYEATRIDRDFQNSLNRTINLDVSNQKKTNKAAEYQIELINKLMSSEKFRDMSKKIKALCKIRLSNPDSSFSELEYLMRVEGISITKAGISNLFKIMQREVNDN